MVDAGAIAHLAQMILNEDAKLKVSYIHFTAYCFKCHFVLVVIVPIGNAILQFYKFIVIGFQRQVFSALSQIAKHSVDLAEMVVEAEIFPAVLSCLKGTQSDLI